MKKIISFLLSVLMLLSLTSCSKAEATWQQHYDLGIKYVNEAKYDEAILAFTKALEIDPKKAEVYIALADVYVQQGDYAAAQTTLDNAVSQTGPSSELEQAKEKVLMAQQGLPYIADSETIIMENGITQTNYYDENGNIVKVEFFDADGNLFSSQTMSYAYYPDGNLKAVFTTEQSPSFPDEFWPHITLYNADGSVRWYSQYSPLVTTAEFVYLPETDSYGALIEKDFHSPSFPGLTKILIEYGEDGMLYKETYYTPDGSVDFYEISQCDENGNVIRTDQYEPDGTPVKYYIYTYDDYTFVSSEEHYY